MQRQDFWYKSELKSMGAVPSGTKVGQFLFISMQTATNLDTGELTKDIDDIPAEVSGNFIGPGQPVMKSYFGPTMAQTWTVYQNLSKILAQQGASLRDVVRQRIYLRDVQDVEWMEQVMLSFFPGEKPSTLILGIADNGLHPDIRVWVDCIALVPQEGGLVKEAIYLPELEKVTAPYPQAVKVGQFLFYDGMIGVDAKSGYPVATFDEIGPEGRRGKPGRYIDAAFEATKAQYWLAHMHIKRLLESQGASMRDILQTYTFRRFGVRMFAETDYMRDGKLYESVMTSPTSEGFGIRNLSIIPEVEVINGGVALLPGEYKKEALGFGGADRTGTHAGLTKAGPFWFSVGIPVDLETDKHIINFSDCDDEGRFLAEGRIDFAQLIMARAWFIYKKVLAKDNMDPSTVVQQTVYLENPSYWPAVERVASIVFGGNIPPTAVIPCDQIAYYRQYHERVPQSIGGQWIEIGMWGITNEGGKML